MFTSLGLMSLEATTYLPTPSLYLMMKGRQMLSVLRWEERWAGQEDRSHWGQLEEVRD